MFGMLAVAARALMWAREVSRIFRTFAHRELVGAGDDSVTTILRHQSRSTVCAACTHCGVATFWKHDRFTLKRIRCWRSSCVEKELFASTVPNKSTWLILTIIPLTRTGATQPELLFRETR